MSNPSQRWFHRLARYAVASGIFLLLAVMVAGSAVAPSARAATPEENAIVIPPGPGTPVVVVGDIYKEISKKASGFFTTLTLGGVTTLMNVFQTVSQRMAADVANRILTGDAGQYPLFWEDDFGDYLGKVGEEAGNQFISSINEEIFNSFGFDLCTPIDPLSLQLSLGLTDVKFLEAKCTAAKVGAAFEQTKEAFNTSAEAFTPVAQMFDPRSSELSGTIGFHNEYLDKKEAALKAAVLSRTETEGFKQVKDVISGKIQTPSQVIQESVRNGNLLGMMIRNNETNYAGLFANAFEIGFTQLGTLTVSTFVNTLANGLLQKVFDGLTGGSLDSSEIDLAQSQAVTNRNVAKARILFSDLLTPNLISTDQQDFIAELSTCPEPRGLWGCSMDDAFAVALRTVGEVGAYTVGRASHVVLNGQSPSNSAFLHKDWQLIPDSDVQENSDPTCYQRAYCASNLAKLRYARILPVGWEIAANSPYNKKSNGKYVTLEEVIRGFNVCNSQGQADGSHPWCKLIDPNWVLSAPPFQCRVKGHGDTTFPGGSLRLEECADAISCLGRDDQGKCNAGYGYCVAEKPVWRFTADTCLERFASCRTYSTRLKEQVSYLRNTVDYGSCTADNVGCYWYATERDPQGSSEDAWVGDLAATSGPRIYLDAGAKACNPADDGCTKLLQVQPAAPALNLIANGSFELGVPNDDTKRLKWQLPFAYQAPNVQVGLPSVYGSQSLQPQAAIANIARTDAVAMAPVRNYTLSIHARSIDTSTTANLDVKLMMVDANGLAVSGSNYYRSVGCTVAKVDAVGFLVNFTADSANADWQRFECSFVSDAGIASGQLEVLGTNALIDAIQLEETERATAFVDGLSSVLSVVHLRVPPDEFACTGQSTDHPSCAKYARICRQSDQGCQGYRDVQNPTAPEIPASLSAVDFCPASCVGYAEYRKQPSAFDLGLNTDDRLNDPQDDTSANFVPAYARQCSLEDVGCEEFTDVGSTSTGAEQKGYYNYVRACQQPNQDSETFFTWEGSDTTGYQLRTWSLIHDPLQVPPAPKLIQKAGPDGILKDPNACNAGSWQTGADADCRQFFNANGVVFYAYFSQTILSSTECRDLRKNNSNAADCAKTGGSFTPTSGECLYQAVPSLSRSCREVNTGCRAYIGTTGRNTAVVFEEDFRSSTTSAAFTQGVLSNESVLVGDQSLKVEAPDTQTATVFPSLANSLYSVSFWAKTTSPALQNATLIVDGQTVVSIKMEVDWRRYEFGPFAVSSTTPTSTIAWTNLPNASFIDQIRIERLMDVSYVVKNSWTIPQECDQTPEGLPEPQAMLGCRAYQDRTGAGVNVRRFGHLCREEAVGCKAFVDTRNSDDPYGQTFVLSGTNVNSKVDAAGNPIEPAYTYEQKYLGDATTTRAADRYLYLIDEPSARCDAGAASCRAFGKPKFQQDQLALSSPSTTAFETVYYLDDITQYLDQTGEPGILCRKNELFCEEFKSGKTLAYFRTPQNHTCEWKDKVLLKASVANNIPADGEYTGWFRTGTDVPCYPGVLSSGNTYLIQNSGDPSYTGWVGTCPVEQSECTEFRDSNDHSDPIHPSGKPYFFIKNSRLDLKSCGGQVDLLSGCVLFRDLSDTRNRYSTVATYAKSAAEADSPQAPIDCISDPNNSFCQQAGRCVGVELVSCAGAGCSINFDDPETGTNGAKVVKAKTGAACSVDADCGQTSNSPDGYDVKGTCQYNDANIVLKVNLDRDCAKWLGCSSSETVYDPAQQKYVDLCTDVAMCDVSKGTGSDAFCAHYIDRTQEPILKQGVFFDRSVYSSRQTGFGQIDYSGYSIPDHFQASDIQNRRVGFELFAQTPSLANNFAQDYRLVAAVPESLGLVDFNIVDNLYPTLSLCQHIQTGRMGYHLNNAAPNRVCYFSADGLTIRSTEAEVQGDQKVDPRDIQPLADILRQSKDPRNDKVLIQALAAPECLAHPEGDSPFPNLYVSEWNFETEPFRPETIAGGYESVNLCQFGEDCDCSYRKVKYGGQKTLYYSPFGPTPLGGICSGGTKDGESCVPGTTISENADGSVAQISTAEDPGCPGGGRCLEITDVALVRGQFGQCLQRDYSRTVANDPGRYPCLIWNPNPILAGSKDIYHYQPTAGYLPPVNAGEYYCLSYANPPFETIWTAQSRSSYKDSRQRGPDPGGDGGNPFFFLPGQLSKFNYDRGYIAGRCPDTADTCGDGEEDCNCLDGVSNIENVLPTDAAVPPSTVSANTDYDEIFNSLGKTFDNGQTVKAVVDLFGNDDDKDCTLEEDPLDDSCDELYRFQNLGAGIDGVSLDQNNEQSWQATWCAEASGSIPSGGDEDGSNSWPGHGGEVPGIGPAEKSPDADYSRGRWIMTGRGISKTYMEYFFPVKPKGVVSWLYGGIDESAIDADLMKEALREKNFAQFEFFPTNDKFLAACSIPKWYVDNVTIDDFKDINQVSQASNQIFSAFTRDFDGTLDRSKEVIVKDSTGRPVKEVCSGLNDGNAPVEYQGDDGRCYMKAWEVNYRMDGTRKFDWLNAESGESFWDRHDNYYARERTCSKSGFAIRALFENVDKAQNNIPESDVNENQLSGPYQFIGFWVTACTNGTDKESFLYLNLRVKHADVCSELAQVISPFSRESAAFSDRVWSRGSFAIPLLGYTYVSNYTPFGSALVNGLPGLSPLFQIDGEVESYSPLKPPTFLASGEEYVTSRQSPLHKWSHLSNIFARIYRIYRYYDTGVSRESWACFGGANNGGSCPIPPDGNVNDPLWQQKIDEVCGGKGECNSDAVPLQAKNAVYRCNGLSGVNAGLECGSGFSKGSLDPICHNAAMKRVSGILEPQLTACNLRSNWKTCVTGSLTQYSDDNCNNKYNASTAHTKNAFGCASDAVLPGAGCGQPETKSIDCPLKVTGIACIKDDFGPMAGHCGGGYEHARCSHNVVDGDVVNPPASNDCVFTASQWWGAYDTGKPYSGQVALPVIPGIFSSANSNAHSVANYYPADGSLPPSSIPFALPFGLSGTSQGATAMDDIGRTQNALMGLDIAQPFAIHLYNGAYTNSIAGNLAQRWPAPHSVSRGSPDAVIAGLCEGAEGASQDPSNIHQDIPEQPPQVKQSKDYLYGEVSSYGHAGYGTRAPYALQVGQCDGGINDQQSCYNKSDIPVSNVWPHPNVCAPPVNPATPLCRAVAQINSDGSQTPDPQCEYVGGTSNDPFSLDPDLDNNICTRSAGYKPRQDICGQNPDNEKCLIGYNLLDSNSLKQTDYLTPTDVTPGLHTPVFLGLTGANPYDYEHIAHYAPRPPSMAAPDLSRTCQSPGSCPISTVGGFTLEDQGAGPLSFAGGQGQVDMRFYGWAAHDQGPLKAVYIDWGDGTIVKVEDARMKNKKPFCATTSECTLVPGLTCNSDADCPPAGGKCAPRGTCSQTPSLSCFSNSECGITGKQGDKCVIREFFGNSTEACEANFFEFTHAFACDGANLPSCDTNDDDSVDMRCSSNPDIVCTSSSQCGGGDTCMAGLAPSSVDGVSGGCFDEEKNACIYTPKVMLKDSWNWCTGDCRAGNIIGNVQTDASDTKVKHLYGGCWDGTETVKNTNVQTKSTIMIEGIQNTNECTISIQDDKPNVRPWIVYPGAVEVGVIQ